MPYSIEKVPGAPIVILSQETRSAMAEMSGMIDSVWTVLNAQPEPVFLVLDIAGPASAIDDMSIAASLIARRQSALLLHKNVRETLIVTRASAARRSAMGLSTAVFGQAKIRRFDSVEQALSSCYAQTATLAERRVV